CTRPRSRTRYCPPSTAPSARPSWPATAGARSCGKRRSSSSGRSGGWPCWRWPGSAGTWTTPRSPRSCGRRPSPAFPTPPSAPPPECLSKVIRAADRWRGVDHDPAAACQAAARIVQRLGDRELGWDYLTTPVGLKPNESGPWLELAVTLSRQGELDLADRGYK